MIVSDLSERTYVPSIDDLFKQRQDNFSKAKALAKSDKPKVDVKKVKDDSVKCSLDQDPDETRAPFFDDSEGDNKGATDFPVTHCLGDVSQRHFSVHHTSKEFIQNVETAITDNTIHKNNDNSDSDINMPKLTDN